MIYSAMLLPLTSKISSTLSNWKWKIRSFMKKWWHLLTRTSSTSVLRSATPRTTKALYSTMWLRLTKMVSFVVWEDTQILKVWGRPGRTGSRACTIHSYLQRSCLVTLRKVMLRNDAFCLNNSLGKYIKSITLKTHRSTQCLQDTASKINLSVKLCLNCLNRLKLTIYSGLNKPLKILQSQFR